MQQYLNNIWKWLKGFSQLRSVDYKPGWSAGKFFLPYLLNYGTHVILSGGAVVSWSRYFYESRQAGSRTAKFLDRLLSKIDKDHGEKSSPPLWGTTPCRTVVRLAVVSFWVMVTIFLVAQSLEHWS